MPSTLPASKGHTMAGPMTGHFWYPHNNANRFESSFTEVDKSFLRELASGSEFSRSRDARMSVQGTQVQDRAARLYSNPGDSSPGPDGAPVLTGSFGDVSNLRSGPHVGLPPGRCVYVNSVDSGDFDNYMAAAALSLVASRTPNMEFFGLVATRRACRDRTEVDKNAHVEEFSKQVMDTSGTLLRALCPRGHVIAGPLNERGVLSQSIIPNEVETYHSATVKLPKELTPGWETLNDLAQYINAPTTTSVMMDMMGPVGWVEKLEELCPELGTKLRACPFPIPIVGGVLAEKELQLQVPNYGEGDSRATLNALKHSPEALLRIARLNNLRLLFVTPYVSRMLCFDDAAELVGELGLSGLLATIAMSYYGKHLKGEFVPADWVATVAALLVRRHPGAIRTERRELYVGSLDKSVMVLVPMGGDKAGVAGLEYWGVVESLVNVDREMLVSLARSIHYQQADAVASPSKSPAKGARPRTAHSIPTSGAPPRPFSDNMYTPGARTSPAPRARRAAPASASARPHSPGRHSSGGGSEAPLPQRSASPSVPPPRPDLSAYRGAAAEGYIEGSNVKSENYGDMRYLPLYKSHDVQNSIAMSRHYKRVPVQSVELQSGLPVAKAHDVRPGVRAQVKLWEKPWWQYNHYKYYGFAGRGARTSWARNPKNG
mmetsp:Transcript_69476/g.219890  ORF Transcript_69476/g.219890 Transcript_69476/m.219890 type:complete len:660 (-) Transcript_69476:13-1992(-)